MIGEWVLFGLKIGIIAVCACAAFLVGAGAVLGAVGLVLRLFGLGRNDDG